MDKIKLILTDNKFSVEIFVNKNDLADKSGYFYNLLNKYSSSCQNKTIFVPNSLASKNIIENLLELNSSSKTNYDFKYDLKYILELIKCYDYFSIDINLKKFNLSGIKHNEFDILLDVIDIVGYNDYNIKLILKNLPNDYDLSKFPHDLLKKMYEIASSYMMIISHNCTIYFFDGNNGDLIKTWYDPTINHHKHIIEEKYGDYYEYRDYMWIDIKNYEINIKKILPITKNKIIYMIKSSNNLSLSVSQTNLFNIKSEKLTNNFDEYDYASYSPVHYNLAFIKPTIIKNESSIIDNYEKIEIYSLNGDLKMKIPIIKPQKLIKQLPLRNPPEGKNARDYPKLFHSIINYSPNGKYIACTNYISQKNYSIMIIDYNTGYIVNEFFYEYNISSFCFSPNSDKIIITYHNKKSYVDLLNIITSEILDKIVALDEYIFKIIFLNNMKFITMTNNFQSEHNEYSHDLFLCDIQNKTQKLIYTFIDEKDTYYCPVKKHLIILEKSGLIIINPISSKIKKINVCSVINQYISQNFHQDIRKIGYFDYSVAITPNYHDISKKLKKYLKKIEK
ncbi:DPP6 N-terminal domain-containing protein [Megavirus chiliensis]|uniref:WD repeat family n=2 Tax=Megamimivirinae TaxID=3044648 RepID=A0A2L2DNX7_MIMIV|nr:hypothetical protein MegaChil _gp1025 [Megavirus chiliensis]AEQ33166.1 DPP6 N-terminal domain-containing protein [Megavirus chiliensis]AVG47862.1 WD repeat family [Acanthamoeba polyphaga mimivirus]